MTSKLVVNTIEADTGISSVSFASSISMSSTSVFHFSDAGVNIGADTNISRLGNGILGFKINGAEKFRIDSSGHIKATGVCTATAFHGDGSNLSGISSPAITSIASDGANRVLTSDGDGTATAHSFVTIENNRLSVNRGSGSGSYPLIVRRTDASGIIAEFANNGGYGLLIGQNSATGEAYLRTGTGQPMVFTTNAGSGIANERLRISSEGYVTKPTQPSFHARRTNNASSTSNPLVFQDAHHNNGSHYKTSGSDQGKFVAPVAGVYLFYWCAIKTNAGSVCRLYIKKNGSNIYGQMHLRLQESGTYSNGSIQAILNLAAGDKVHISLEAGSIHGSEYTHFGGYLIH